MECKTKRILDVSDLIKKKSLFLFGPRQTGKSTLVDQLSDETFALKWNLLKGKLRLQIQRNPSYLTEQVELLGLHDCAIFIDEIQAYPHLLTLLKFLSQDNKFTFIASGSLLGVTLSQTTSIPIGSIRKVRMFPLDFEEFLYANGMNELVISSSFSSRLM